MKSLIENYRPITAQPFCAGQTEVLPCAELIPYIRCFWGGANGGKTLVIPDTCMDIIFAVDAAQKRCTGIFCAADERSYFAAVEPGGETFAVRFYAWTAALFAGRDFCGSRNKQFAAGEFFGEIMNELEQAALGADTLRGRAALAEKALAARIGKISVNDDFMNSVDCIIRSRGTAEISQLQMHTALSERKLERLFNRYMGLSPKSFSSLVRYQLLWQEMACNRQFSTLDAVCRYRYFDQAHLLNDFKKRHLMTPAQAVRFARGDVGFLQDLAADMR